MLSSRYLAPYWNEICVLRSSFTFRLALLMMRFEQAAEDVAVEALAAELGRVEQDVAAAHRPVHRARSAGGRVTARRRATRERCPCRCSAPAWSSRTTSSTSGVVPSGAGEPFVSKNSARSATPMPSSIWRYAPAGDAPLVARAALARLDAQVRGPELLGVGRADRHRREVVAGRVAREAVRHRLLVAERRDLRRAAMSSPCSVIELSTRSRSSTRR